MHMNKPIGGQLTMRALAARHGAATQHKPQTRPQFACEAQRLARTGLLPGDIAQVLGLTANAVIELLAGRT